MNKVTLLFENSKTNEIGTKWPCEDKKVKEASKRNHCELNRSREHVLSIPSGRSSSKENKQKELPDKLKLRCLFDFW